MANFQIKGMENLGEDRKKEVQSIIEASYEKIKRKTKTDFLLKFVIREYSKSSDKENKKGKYSIQATISGSTKNFDASSYDWDLNKAIHMVVEKLENEVEHAFHASEQHN